MIPKHIVLGIAPLMLASVLAQNIPDSCAVHDWFQLHDKVEREGGSQLCRGAVDAAFESRREAERELKGVIRKAPHSDDALSAHRILISVYYRHGQYRKALSQVKQGLGERPDAKDLEDLRSMLAVLAQFPDLWIGKTTRSVVQGEVLDNNVFTPLTARGVPATYMLDSGANISVICESEAKRLGLKVHKTTSTMSDIGGVASAVRLAETPELWIGRIHLKNVAFAVYPDSNEPFVDLPSGHKAVLGIPVLLALGSLRLERDLRLVLADAGAVQTNQSIPLAFDNQLPLAAIPFQGKKLTFTLDTGASKTYLYKPFANAFPELTLAAQRREQTVTGLSGKTSQESMILPTVRFLLAPEVQVELSPATVILHTTTEVSQWSAGNFGFDLLSKALPVTLDFRSMQMRFDSR